jgi:hypothetical protein
MKIFSKKDVGITRETKTDLFGQFSWIPAYAGMTPPGVSYCLNLASLIIIGVAKNPYSSRKRFLKNFT